MFQPGTRVFISDGGGKYSLSFVRNDGTDTVQLEGGCTLHRGRILGRGPRHDRLEGLRFSVAVNESIDHGLGQDLRLLGSGTIIPASLLFRILEPMLSAARDLKVVVGGLCLELATWRYQRIEVGSINLFDWDFVAEEARSLYSDRVYRSLRVFAPDEWNRIDKRGGQLRLTSPPRQEKPDPAVVEAFIDERFRMWASGHTPRPKYEMTKSECRAQTGATEPQMRMAWDAVAKWYSVRKGRPPNTDGKC